MAALIEAITVKRKMYFEFENTPYYCMEAEVSQRPRPAAAKRWSAEMRNLLTRAVFDKTFRPASASRSRPGAGRGHLILYSDSEGSHFMDQESFETLTLNSDMMGKRAGASVNTGEVSRWLRCPITTPTARGYSRRQYDQPPQCRRL